MCVLCGEFVSQPHWAERRVEDEARSEGVEASDYHRSRRRERIQRAGLTNRVLRHYGLEVEDWNGSKYILRDRKGRSELVQDLGSLWPAAAKLAGQTPDPLDLALCEAMSREAE